MNVITLLAGRRKKKSKPHWLNSCNFANGNRFEQYFNKNIFRRIKYEILLSNFYGYFHVQTYNFFFLINCKVFLLNLPKWISEPKAFLFLMGYHKVSLERVFIFELNTWLENRFSFFICAWNRNNEIEAAQSDCNWLLCTYTHRWPSLLWWKREKIATFVHLFLIYREMLRISKYFSKTEFETFNIF